MWSSIYIPSIGPNFRHFSPGDLGRVTTFLLCLRSYNGHRRRFLAPVFLYVTSLSSGMLSLLVVDAIVGNVDSAQNRLYSFESPWHLMA
jgi:hypothetical protein